ncbi:MAG: hypothetical protein KME01_02510 [Chroococcus sp. CMT-3BRIN-NPC107]|jgi:hypothetical protein|nr:hypothetical protein [Chroococcus sp. CMT-3BRIN-NPC107]
MNTQNIEKRRFLRPVAILLSAVLSLSIFTGCGSRVNTAAPVDNNRVENQGYNNSDRVQQPRQGISNKQKVVILAGAAALYYLYNQHKNKKAEGAEGQYYLSKNGRVYYRDAQRQVHWVTPPSEGIQVPETEAQRYRDFQGYNNRPTGRDLTDLQPAPAL